MKDGSPRPGELEVPGEAGRRGEDVRSDLHVAVEPRQAGGIELVVRSKVEPYYGDAIRGQVLELLAALGVRDARLEIEDAGALPFVIAARVEAACRRAGWGALAGDARPARLAPLPPPSPRHRLRRSRLYLPGNEPKFMVNAALHGPDAIILDLEDSVHTAEKDAARLLVRNALRVVDFGSAERMVRVNPLPLGLLDLDAILPASPDLVLLPKVDEPEQVRQAGERLEALAKTTGDGRPVWLMPILETALGIERALDIARAHPAVVALTLGLEDLTTDLGVAKTATGEETAYARARTVMAARAAGVQAIDSVWGDVGDLAGLLAWGRRSRGMGFEGMGCVHPRQIRVIHEAFAPAADEIARALRIVEAFEEAQAKGLAVVSLGSKMIDPPVVERARRLVTRSREEKQ